jgi:hypothetical protein
LAFLARNAFFSPGWLVWVPVEKIKVKNAFLEGDRSIGFRFKNIFLVVFSQLDSKLENPVEHTKPDSK